MKRKKLMIFLIIIIIIVIILAAKFFNIWVRDAKPKDLELRIYMENNTFSLNTEEIIIEISLRNKCKDSVKVPETFCLGYKMNFNLTTPNHRQLAIVPNLIKPSSEKIILEPNDKLTCKVNLVNLMIIFHNNNTDYEWEVGLYSIKCFYNGVGSRIYSNELNFTINPYSRK